MSAKGGQRTTRQAPRSSRLAEQADRRLDHRVGPCERDAEPARQPDGRARQHEEALGGQLSHERGIVGVRTAGHHVERALWVRRLVALLDKRRDEHITPTLERVDVDAQVGDIGQGTLQERIRERVVADQLCQPHRRAQGRPLRLVDAW